MTTAAGDFARGWTPGTPTRGRRARVRRLARALAHAYGTPDLGNLADPLDEAIYIVLTYQTDVPRARQVFRALKVRFPTWGALTEANAAEVEDILRPSGLQKTRGRMIRLLLKAVHKRFGRYSLDALKAMSPDEAEAVLRSLPGLDLKGARCVSLYSLGRPVLPIDSNTYRFMSRYGVLARAAKYRRRTVHDGLQQLVPEGDRFKLHVNLVVHGQTVCLPRKPRCSECCVRRTCTTGRSHA